MNFGKWLKRYRSLQNLTQRQVSDALGYSIVTYRRVEQGGTPSVDFIDRLIEYLHIPIEEQAMFRHFAITHEHPDSASLLLRLTQAMELPSADPSTSATTHDDVLDNSVTTPNLPVPPPALDFIGRQEELDFYKHELTTSHLAVITGMTGVGKTTLATMLAQQCAPADSIFWHQFYPNTGINDLLWRLMAFLAWHGEDALWQQHAVIQSGRSAPPIEVQIDYLVQCLQKHKLLLCFDDMHYVDTNNHFLQFINRLLPILSTTGLSLIVTAQRMPTLPHMTVHQALNGLSRVDAQALLQARNLALPTNLMSKLHQVTDGNAALLVMTMEALHHTPNPETVIQHLLKTPNVVHYLMHKIHAQFVEDTRSVRVMRAIAAFLRHPGSRDAIEAMLEENGVWEILYDLGRRYLVHIHQSSTGEPLYTQHTLIQSFYYEQLGKRERYTFHMRAGMYYAEKSHNDQDILKAMLHFEQAGAHEHIINLITNDIWGLINQGYAQALSHILERLTMLHLEESQWIQVYIARGMIATFLRDSTTAHDSYQRAFDCLAMLPDSPTTRQQQAQICEGMGELLEYEHPQEALRWLHRGLAALQGEPTVEAGRLHLRIGSVYVLLSEYTAAQQALETCLQLLSEQLHHERGQALTCLGVLACAQGHFRSGKEYFTRALHIYQRTRQYWSMLGVQQNISSLMEISGAWQEAAAMGTQALHLAERLHHIVRQTELALNLGILRTKQGNFTEARKLFLQSLMLAQQHHLHATIVSIQVSLADLYIRSGDYEAATHILTTAAHLAAELETTDQLAEIYRARALIHLRLGDHATALTCAQDAVQQAQVSDDSMGEGIGLHVLGQVQYTQGDYEQSYTTFTRSLMLVQEDPYESAQTQTQWGIALLADSATTEGRERLKEAHTTFRSLGAIHDLAQTNRLLTSQES